MINNFLNQFKKNFRPILNTSVLNNEFFAQACLEWTERLAEGEFTPENQQKMKIDIDREKSKLDPFKVSQYIHLKYTYALLLNNNVLASYFYKNCFLLFSLNEYLLQSSLLLFYSPFITFTISWISQTILFYSYFHWYKICA